MLRLADGATLLGDCLTVVDAGYAGRPAPLRHEDMASVEEVLRAHFVGRRYASFREAAASLDDLALPGDTMRPVAYGVTQALLGAAAHAAGTTMAEVIAREFGGKVASQWPGFAAVCEGDWYANVDKAIVRRVAMFPHCGIQKKEDVERLPDYVAWMLGRVEKLGSSGYKPDLHIDFHSMLGRMLGNDVEQACDFLAGVADRARPYTVYFEDPLLAETADQARENLQNLRHAFDKRGLSCRLIADEWANSPGQVAQFAADRAAHAIQVKMPDNGNLLNTIRAVRSCQEHGVLAYLGGSVNETDVSARVSVHLGLALDVWRVLVKPAKGHDEGLMIKTNEVARTLAAIPQASRGAR
jgi:methylaspartate ammonia-lyase